MKPQILGGALSNTKMYKSLLDLDSSAWLEKKTPKNSLYLQEMWLFLVDFEGGNMFAEKYPLSKLKNNTSWLDLDLN